MILYFLSELLRYCIIKISRDQTIAKNRVTNATLEKNVGFIM